VLGALEPGRLLAIGGALVKSALILAPFAYLAWKVVPTLLLRVARTGNDELFLMVALALGLGTAALTQTVGLSVALGAFLAGLMISNSDYAHQALARLLPVRDIFVAVFFVTIGTLIDPATVVANLPLLVAIIGLVVVGKLVIWRSWSGCSASRWSRPCSSASASPRSESSRSSSSRSHGGRVTSVTTCTTRRWPPRC
jgi:CPA2 family monovalent cation:H+ antiporter-2